MLIIVIFFFFSSRRRHTRWPRDWSSDVCFFFSSRRRHTRWPRDWCSDVCSSDLVDIKDFELPLLDEPMPHSMGNYQQAHTKRWAAKIASLDAFVFVSPEYNHGIPAALKNAIDFLFAEWKDKAAGFVSYGGAGGARAVEQLRLVLAEVHVATVRAQVLLSMMTDFENFTTFKPHL